MGESGNLSTSLGPKFEWEFSLLGRKGKSLKLLSEVKVMRSGCGLLERHSMVREKIVSGPAAAGTPWVLVF